MIRRPFPAAAFLSLLGLLGTGVSIAATEGGPRIDLGFADPSGLEELPGIDEAEIDLLREISGPGSGDLGSRLAETGIDRERLQRWAPYLEISGTGDPHLRRKLRIDCERVPAHPFQSHLRLSLGGNRVCGDARVEQTFSAHRTSGGVVREARAGVGCGPSMSVWVGSCTGGIQGGNPWEDPLRRSSTSSPLSRCFRMRSSRTASGIVAMSGSHGVAAWKRHGERFGLLLARTDKAHGVWYGRESDRGDGIGGICPLGRLWCSAVLHRPANAPAVVRLGLQAVDRPTHAALCWALGSRDGRPRTRFDAGTSGRLGIWKVRLALAFLTDDREARTRSRGTLRLGGGRGSMRASWKVAWNERSTRFQADADLDLLGGYRLRFEGRSTVAAGCAPVLLSLVPSRELCRGRIELGLLGRTEEGLSWPGIGVRESAGRVAVRLGVDGASGGIRIRTLLLAPVRTSGRVAPQDLLWRFSLEQRGG